MKPRHNAYAYRCAVARTAGRHERSSGMRSDDPAALWLALSPSERVAFAGEVRSPAALAGWMATRREAKRKRNR